MLKSFMTWVLEKYSLEDLPLEEGSFFADPLKVVSINNPRLVWVVPRFSSSYYSILVFVSVCFIFVVLICLLSPVFWINLKN